MMISLNRLNAHYAKFVVIIVLGEFTFPINEYLI